MKGYETYRTISVERRGRILVLTLDRPDALNAVDAALHAELARIFVEVRHDAEADVVVLTGRGRAFCAGGDIDWMQAAIDDPALFEETGRQAKEIVAGDGGALIWPQLVGYTKARHYLFTGELMTAAEAERLGLITKVVPEAELDDAVYGLAERLAASPRKALQWTKTVTNLPLKALFQAHFDAGVAYASMSNLTADHQEAVAAFREKRKPLFAGR